MTTMRAIQLAACCLALMLVANPASASMILDNPGFESGLAPWFANSGTPTLTSAEAHSGSFSVAAFSNDEIRQDFSATLVSDITEVSFWIKRVGGPFNFVEFFYSDNTTGNTLVNAVGTGDDWKFFDVTAFLTPGKSLSGIGIYGTSSGPAYFDDFTVATSTVEIPEPSSLALFGLGSIGLASFARRRRQGA